MKILKRPSNQNWPKKIECAKCRALLEIDLNDLDYDSWVVSGYHFDGSAVSKWKYTFKCMACGHWANGNEISEDEIPLEHRDNIKKRSSLGSHFGARGLDKKIP